MNLVFGITKRDVRNAIALSALTIHNKQYIIIFLCFDTLKLILFNFI